MSRPPAHPSAGRLVALAALLLAASAGAQSRAPAPVLDSRMRAEVIEGLTGELMRNYVEPDTAGLIAEVVRARLKAGAYDTLTSASGFAVAVTADLRRVNGDLHLSLRFDPEGGGGSGDPVIVRRTGPGGEAGPRPPGGGPAAAGGGPGPEGAGGPVIVRGVGPGPGEDSAAVRVPWAREAREKNFGLGRAEILAGNVGYLEITGFLEAPGMEEALVGALRLLERTDAMIVDVRRNGGGSGEMSHLVFSHFLPGTPVPTIRVRSRVAEMNRVQESLADVPGPRRPDVPLYVLTSRFTGSAAEEFSFVLKNLGRATIVGDRTGGAGHMVGLFPVPHGFVAGVSITRVSDPRTGREWEGVGVQPDLRVAPERALAAAHAAALRALAARADPTRRSRLEMALEWVEARDRGARPSAGQLAPFAGAYEGDREVLLEGGRLTFRRRGGMGEDLVPLGGRRFSLNGEARITFGDGARAPSLTVDRADGSSATYRRTSLDRRGD